MTELPIIKKDENLRMLCRSMKFKHALLLGLLVLSVFMLPAASGQVTQKTFVILYDQSHGQYFTKDNMTTVFNNFKQIETKFNIKIELRTLNTSFNFTNLQGVDLLIVSNPSENATLSATEKSALANYASNGGSTLYLGNPYSFNNKISSHPRIINEMMNLNLQSRADFVTRDATKPNVGTVMIDDFNNKGNISYLTFKRDTITPESLVSGVKNISQVVFYGTGVLDKNSIASNIKQVVYGNTSSTAYLVTGNYTLTATAELFHWFVGKSYANSRSLSIGSTIMFSDMFVNNNKTLGKWINQGDNLGFFINTVTWLLKIIPQQNNAPIINQSFQFFIEFNLMVSIIAALLFVLLVVSVLVFSKKMSFADVFKVRVEKVGYGKSRSRGKTSEGSDESTPTKKERTKKRRKRKSAR